MLETPEDYLASLPPTARAWVAEFIDYVQEKYPTQQLTMFRQRPMFKFGRSYQQGYVMFTAAASHFTVHAIEFDLIEAMHTTLPTAQFGKGSIKVRFSDEAAKPMLRAFVDEVLARHAIERG